MPLAQLYVRDVPQLRPPGRTDLLQVLWCPSEHPPEHKPPTELFWRTAADVTHVLASPPKPSGTQYGYIPEPCVLAPEQIIEYPNFLELDEELQQQLNDWSVWQAASVAIDDFYETAPKDFYSNELAEAPGWKVGGWAPWGLTDPIARFCINCGTAMTPLLTIASDECRDYRRSWGPNEDQHIPEFDTDNVSNPPDIQVSGGNHLQLYICSTCYTHTDLIQ
ncbi:hypothetical protein [Streptomyces sp. NPDC058401]|uniref:hypothetical protein n=1 Tax=Streptomyces sp. NPDC058401 TaxID=3346480 RepID=UPI0036529226